VGEIRDMMHYKSVILGGGLAGIGAKLADPDALLIEKNDSLLGHAASFSHDGIYFDQGAHICHSVNTEWLDLIESDRLLKKKSNEVCNFEHGQKIGYPVQNNLNDIPFKEIAYEQLRNNQKKNPRYDNYYNWCVDVYGSFLTEKYYQKFTRKYWRTEMYEMNTDWFKGRILPVDMKFVDEGYSGKPASQAVFKDYMYPSAGGFAGLFTPLLAKLDAATVKLNSRVVHVNDAGNFIILENGERIHYDRLTSTLPLPKILRLTEKRTSLEEYKYTHLIVTAVTLDENCQLDLPDWFYFYDEDLEFSRAMNMSKVQDIVGKSAFQFETFRRNDEKFVFEDVCLRIEGDVSRFLDRPKNVLNFKHLFVEFAYVVPTIGIQEIVVRDIKALKNIGITTIGLYGKWNYVWSDAAFMQGFKNE
jgi:protoporphyrinogen oxidase